MLEDKLLLQQHLRQRDNVPDALVKLFKLVRQIQDLPLLQGQVEVGLVLGRLVLADMVDVVENGPPDVDLLDSLGEFFELKNRDFR